MSTELPIKDSGKREAFASGAVRDVQDNKPQYGLLPVYALSRIAMTFVKGRKKYPPEQREGERVPVENWRRGFDTARLMESLLRHAFAYLEGHRDEDHMAQAAWNALVLIETEEMVRRGILPPSLLTLSDWTQWAGNLTPEAKAEAERLNQQLWGLPKDPPLPAPYVLPKVEFVGGPCPGDSPCPPVLAEGSRWNDDEGPLHWLVKDGRVVIADPEDNHTWSSTDLNRLNALVKEGSAFACDKSGKRI